MHDVCRIANDTKTPCQEACGASLLVCTPVTKALEITKLEDGMSSAPQGDLTDRHTPAAGIGAGGTNYSHGSGYDTGTATKGYMGNAQLLSSGQGYMTSETGAGPGFGVESEGHNTGIGATGAGTGTSGYRHGTGGTVDVAGNGELTNNRKDLNHLKDMLHLHHHKHGES